MTHVKQMFYCDRCDRAVEPTKHYAVVTEDDMYDRHPARRAIVENRCPFCVDDLGEDPEIACQECGEARPEPGTDHCTVCLNRLEDVPVKRILAAATAALALAGCALAPDSIRPEIEHMSHLAQHEPFTDRPTHYGSDIVELLAHWDFPHAYLEVGEGYEIDRLSGHVVDTGTPVYGEIIGPREQFIARAGLIIPVKKP